MKKKITMRKKKKNAVMIAEMPLLCLPSANVMTKKRRGKRIV